MQAKEVEKMKMMADSMMNIAFYATVMDIEKTLRSSIKKLFKDKGVDSKERKQRAKALLMMGKIFMKHGETDTKKGIQIMKDQLQEQMGGGPQPPQEAQEPEESKE